MKPGGRVRIRNMPVHRAIDDGTRVLKSCARHFNSPQMGLFLCLDEEAHLQQAISNRGRRAPSAFRQRDVTRAIRATRAAGVNIARIEIAKDGRIVIITPDALASGGAGEEENSWDRV